MAEIPTLDLIIRETSLNVVSSENHLTDTIIRYDVKKRRIQEPGGNRFSLPGFGAKKFLVSTGISVDGVVEGCIVNTIRHSIELKVHYQVEAIKGSEGKVVHVLHAGPNRTHTLERIIDKWVTNDFVDTKTEGKHEFILNFYSYKKGLVNFLKLKAAEELGLRLDAELKLKSEPTADPLVLNFELSAILPDHNKSIPVKVSATVGRDNSNRELAIINALNENELKSLVQQSVKETLISNSSLHELLYDKRRVSSQCQSRLESVLNGVGRRCIHFSYTHSDEVKIPEERFQRDFPFSYQIKDAKDIQIDNSIRLSLVDVGLYLSADIDDFGKKIEEFIKDIVQDVVYSKYYVDLIVDFEDCENEITRRVTEQCKLIGYSVTQHVVLAELKIMEIARNGFYLEIPPAEVIANQFMSVNKGGRKMGKVANEMGNYATSDANISFNLATVVKGALSDLGKLRHYINPKSDLEKIISEVVDGEIRHTLHGLHPHQVYMEFYDVEVNSTGVKIEELLINGIKQRLEQEFYAVGVSVILKPLPSLLLNRLKVLREKTRMFVIDIDSYVEAGRLEAVPYEVRYSVKNIAKDGWYTFQSLNFKSVEEEIEEIEKLLIADINRKMNLASEEHLRYTEYSNLVQVEQLMQQSSSEIRDKFGINIQIGPVRRLSTEVELSIRDSLKEQTKTRIEEQSDLDVEKVKLLKNHLLDLTRQIHDKELNGGMVQYDNELTDLKQTRDRIIKELSAYDKELFINQIPERKSPRKSVFGILEQDDTPDDASQYDQSKDVGDEE